MTGYGFRIFFSVLGPLLVYFHPVGTVSNTFFIVVLVCMLLVSFGSNVRLCPFSFSFMLSVLYSTNWRAGDVCLPGRFLCANFG